MKKFCVNIMESERGWGQRIDEQKLFETEKEACEFMNEFNARSMKEDKLPDWYMYASVPFLTEVKESA
jgi:hypothetical protein